MVETFWEFEDIFYKGKFYNGSCFVSGTVDYTDDGDERWPRHFADVAVDSFYIEDCYEVDEEGDTRTVSDETFLNTFAEHLYYQHEEELETLLVESLE